MTFEQKVWLENFILNSNELRWQMIDEAKNDPNMQEMVKIVMTHNLQELMEML